MNPFGSNHRIKSPALLVQGFDSAATAISVAATLTASEQREQQSLIEHVREQALHIVSDLVDAVTDSTLDENELPSDRLDSLMLEALDGLDDELDDDLAEAVADALASFGVDDSVINEVFGDNIEAADAAIEAVAATVIANMPDEGDALDEFTCEFIYGEPNEEGFDSVTGKKLSKGKMTTKKVGGKNIRYKAVVAIRNGVKTVKNKRLPGQRVRQSAGQKSATKKARLKARTANSIRKRIKSFKKGQKTGLY